MIGSSLCTEKTTTLSIGCSDPKKNDVNSSFSKKSVDVTVKTSDTGLIDSIELLKSQFKTTVSGSNLTYKIAVQVNRVPSYKVPKVTVKGKVYDKAGNSVSINKTFNYTITKK